MDKKKILEKYFIELNPVFWEEKGKGSFDKLTDREVELLLELCEEKLNYEQAVKQLAYQANPEKAKQVEGEYDRQVAEAGRKYEEDIKQIGEEEDVAVDSIDREEIDSVEGMESDIKRFTKAIIDAQKYEEEKAKLDSSNK